MDKGKLTRPFVLNAHLLNFDRQRRQHAGSGGLVGREIPAVICGEILQKSQNVRRQRVQEKMASTNDFFVQILQLTCYYSSFTLNSVDRYFDKICKRSGKNSDQKTHPVFQSTSGLQSWPQGGALRPKRGNRSRPSLAPLHRSKTARRTR